MGATDKTFEDIETNHWNRGNSKVKSERQAIHFALGLRVQGSAEQQGLDLTEHEERAYSH